MGNKKGASHLEFVLSMIIFMTFVTVALFFFAPTRTNVLSSNTLNFAFDGILGRTQISVDSYSIKLNLDAIPEEIKNSPNPIGVTISDDTDRKTKVFNSTGSIKSSNREDKTIYFNRGGDTFFTILFSENFSDEENIIGTAPLESKMYQITSSSDRKVISEKATKALKANYESSYNSLKDDLKLPISSDFSFALIFSPTDIINVTKFVPGGLDVFADSRRFEVLREDENFAYADLVVRTW